MRKQVKISGQEKRMKRMEWGDAATIYAGVVATAALALEVRRWVESGPRLRLSVMEHAVLTHDDSHHAYIAVTAINVGEVPTTITHMTIQRFPSLWAYLRSKPSWTALVPKPHLDNMPPVLPKLLNTGEQWLGLANRTEDLLEMSKRERLYIGVAHSFAKRPVLARLYFKPNPLQNAEQRD
jgi:hypothetical protein